ncbi:MAG: alpha/beta hydrolase [bacterium]|nr:alpha/beta hydrolase [bacterium]
MGSFEFISGRFDRRRLTAARAPGVLPVALLVAMGLLLATPLLKCRSAQSQSPGQSQAPRQEAQAAAIRGQESPPAYSVRRDLIYGYSPANPDAPSDQDARSMAASGGLEPLLADVFLPESAVASQAGATSAQPAAPRPAIIIIHGGSWQRGDRARMENIAMGLASAGFVAVNIEYSLAPRYRYPAQLEDCRKAVVWIREQAAALNVDPQRVGAFGYSAGAHLALLLATTGRNAQDPARIQAVVAGAPPADLEGMPQTADRTLERLLGADREEAPELYRQASPISHVSSDDPPAFLYHGRYDWIVPVEQSREMAKRLREAGVTVEVFEGDGGHLTSAPFREGTPVGLPAAIRFLKQHL